MQVETEPLLAVVLEADLNLSKQNKDENMKIGFEKLT